MKLYYSLTKDDYVNFNICHIGNSVALKKTMAVQKYGIAATFLVMPFIMHKITGINFNLFMGVFAAVAILWIVFYKLIFKRIMQRGVNKMIKKDTGDFLLGERILEFRDNSIIRVTEEEEEAVSFDKIKKVITNDDSVYIYISEVEAYIIPFRAFQNEEQKKEFMGLIDNFEKNILAIYKEAKGY